MSEGYILKKTEKSLPLNWYFNQNQFEREIKKNTKAIYIETPSNPLLKIVDISDIVNLSKSNDLVSYIDNTFATPLIQKPHKLGIDIVIHSATKYFGGHSDICAGAVASSKKEASDIGIEILQRGGNAIDAAVAVGFSLATTLPRAGNLGGGGFMLVYLKEREEIFYIDYRSKSPINSSIEKLLGTKKIPDRNSSLWERVDYTYLASAVPGTVYGLLEAHKNFGSLDLEQIMQPVIEQAENGIVVSSDLNYVIEVTPQLRADKESLSIYFRDGKALEESSIMKRPDLANTLKEISKNGTKGFYEGVIAEKIVDAMKKNNGLITTEDLKNYKSFFRMPIAMNYKGYKVYTCLLYTSPSPRDATLSRMPSSA